MGTAWAELAVQQIEQAVIRSIMGMTDPHDHPTRKKDGSLLVPFTGPITPQMEQSILERFPQTRIAGDKTAATFCGGDAVAFEQAYAKHMEEQRGQSHWGVL